MSKIILITGGARSGKSTHAEGLLKGHDDVLYIATAVRTDAEMEERIRHHIESRNPRWATHEGFSSLDEALRLAPQPYILLDCVTNMVSNLIFSRDLDFDSMSPAEADGLNQTIEGEFKRLLKAARSLDKTLILVSNEVGMGLVSEYRLGRLFVDFAGFINQMIAKEADEVWFMVAGLPLAVKGG